MVPCLGKPTETAIRSCFIKDTFGPGANGPERNTLKLLNFLVQSPQDRYLQCNLAPAVASMSSNLKCKLDKEPVSREIHQSHQAEKN